MSSSETVVLILVVMVVLGIFIFAVCSIFAAIFVKQQVARHLRPNPHEIQKSLERLRRTSGDLGPDELAAKVIGSQAMFLGLIGVLSGLGGLSFALIGMPIDLSVSTLRQMKMVHMITAIYGNDDLDPDHLEIRYMSLVLGGAGAGRLVGRLLVKLVGESVPFVGSVAGFGINWVVTKSIGESAIAWNKGETLRERGAEKIQRLKQTVRPALGRGVSIPASTHTLGVGVAQSVPLNPIRYCVKCGTTNDIRANYCNACSAPLVEHQRLG